MPVATDNPQRAAVDLIQLDEHLLKRFIERDDESAFAKLVEIHGPMVFGVCRRTLGGHHAAEDAFQATFLVFARKAPTIRLGQGVEWWLHGIAYRTALKARQLAVKKQKREATMPVFLVN